MFVASVFLNYNGVEVDIGTGTFGIWNHINHRCYNLVFLLARWGGVVFYNACRSNELGFKL